MFNNGNYGLYIWTSFGIVFAVFAWNIWVSHRQHRLLLKKLRSSYASQT